MFTCPVCFYARMPHTPTEYNICPCCGTEFEADDEDFTHAELRNFWIAKGAPWFFRQAPVLWNPWKQLMESGVDIPYARTASTNSRRASNTITFLSKPVLVPAMMGEVIEDVMGVAA
jgi:hypothetical protein